MNKLNHLNLVDSKTSFHKASGISLDKDKDPQSGRKYTKPEFRTGRSRVFSETKSAVLDRELYQVAEKLAQNYKQFYENTLRYKCSEENFRRILGDQKIIRDLFESKTKAKYKEPPSPLKIIHEVKGINVVKKNPMTIHMTESLRKVSNFIKPAAATIFDHNTIDILKKFNVKLEKFNMEYKLNGIKGLEEHVFKIQEDMQLKEKQILPKVAKFSRKRFVDLRIACAETQDAVTTSGNYDFSQKLAQVEDSKGELEEIGEKNRIVNKMLDKLYLKWQISNYHKNNKAYVIGF